MPPKEVLLARMLGTLNAPVSNFVGVLAAVVAQLVYVLKAIENKKKQGE
jgi:large subunit ribosomal protein L10